MLDAFFSIRYMLSFCSTVARNVFALLTSLYSGYSSMFVAPESSTMRRSLDWFSHSVSSSDSTKSARAESSPPSSRTSFDETVDMRQSENLAVIALLMRSSSSGPMSSGTSITVFCDTPASVTTTASALPGISGMSCRCFNRFTPMSGIMTTAV